MELLIVAGTVAGTIVALSGAGLVIGRLFKWGVREAMEPDMTAMTGRLVKIEAELNPNSGSSFRDQVFSRLDQLAEQIDSK